MKKAVMILLASVFATGVFAIDYTKKDRLEDMRKMTKSLNHIQKSLVGKCQVCLHQGVEDLKSTLKALDSLNAESYLPKEQANAHKFATKMANNINIYADAMEEAYKEKEHFEAMDMYNLLQRQCVSCHIRIRDWDKNKH